MEEIFKHIEDRRAFLEQVPEEWEQNTIVSKKFRVEKISEHGKDYLSFQKGEEREFYGTLMTERWPGAGRVFFFPYTVSDNGEKRFIEIKGYGQDGKDICLWNHVDGDILYGMFYKNARKEFDILEKAYENGIKVPLPLFLGKISKKEWLKSGLRVVRHLAKQESKSNLSSQKLGNLELGELEKEIKNSMDELFQFSPAGKNPLGAFAQPYNAGIVGRAPISPFRIGDPSDKYAINERNIRIAKECGKSFRGLINLGYFHLSPGTANWTTAGELTDMADCYIMKKDKNFDSIIQRREDETQINFWEDLIGQRHCGNLFPYFIEGMFGEKINLNEAGKELKNLASQKIRNL